MGCPKGTLPKFHAVPCGLQGRQPSRTAICPPAAMPLLHRGCCELRHVSPGPRVRPKGRLLPMCRGPWVPSPETPKRPVPNTMLRTQLESPGSSRCWPKDKGHKIVGGKPPLQKHAVGHQCGHRRRHWAFACTLHAHACVLCTYVHMCVHSVHVGLCVHVYTCVRRHAEVMGTSTVLSTAHPGPH